MKPKLIQESSSESNNFKTSHLYLQVLILGGKRTTILVKSCNVNTELTFAVSRHSDINRSARPNDCGVTFTCYSEMSDRKVNQIAIRVSWGFSQY